MQLKREKQIIKNKELGNRPATCRNYYVHPGIIDAYMDGSLFPIMEKEAMQEKAVSSLELRSEERAVLKILEQHLLQEIK